MSDADRQPGKINFEDLEAFVAVARATSFRHAAGFLGLAQPTVTNRIQRLEERLGLKLFSRTTRRVIPTTAGARLLVRAERLISDMHNLVQDAREEAELKTGRLAIGASPTLAVAFVVPLVRKFMDRHPEVRVRLSDDFRTPILERLRTSDLDLAILPMERAIENFRTDLLYEEDLHIVAPRSLQLATNRTYRFAELAAYPFVSMPAPSAMHTSLINAFAAAGASFRPLIEVNSQTTLLQLIESGVGMSLVSQKILAEGLLRNVDVIKVSDLRLRRHICLVTVRDRALSPAASAFAKMVRVTVRKPPAR